jgi:hypothetical protein
MSGEAANRFAPHARKTAADFLTQIDKQPSRDTKECSQQKERKPLKVFTLVK